MNTHAVGQRGPRGNPGQAVADSLRGHTQPPPRRAPGCQIRDTATSTSPIWPPASRRQRRLYTVQCARPPKDFSSANPVLPGPVWVTQKGPARSGVAAITYLELAGLQGKILSPCSPLRTQVTNALLRACISGTPDGTQRQQVQRIGKPIQRSNPDRPTLPKSYTILVVSIMCIYIYVCTHGIL